MDRFAVHSLRLPSLHPPPAQITATTGDTLGPPWQAPENGYVLHFLGAGGSNKSLYYEPHCRWVGCSGLLRPCLHETDSGLD